MNEEPDTIEKRWRFEGLCYADGSCYLSVHDYPVIKRTACGVWIDVYGQKKFILDGVGKRWARSTKKEALESYVARKSRQVRILASQYDTAVALHKAAQEKFAKGNFESGEAGMSETLALFDLRAS
jgi:hypothetical protein